MVTNYKRCDKCGGLMRKSLVDYKTVVDGKEHLEKDVAGFICSHCDNTFVDDIVAKTIEETLREKTVKLVTEKNVEYLTVSNLKNIRIKKGFSQSEVGNALGVTGSRYGGIERNRNTPVVPVALQLAKVLDVDINDLYYIVSVPKKLYGKLLNCTIKQKKGGEYYLDHLDDIADIRSEIKKLQLEMEQNNDEKRVWRKRYNDNRITEEEKKEKIKELNKKNEKIKDVKDGKNGLTKELEKLERKYSIIIKNESVIDKDDWDIVAKVYKKELKER